MAQDLNNLAASALDALPQPALIVDSEGCVLLRNGAADRLPPGPDVSTVLQAGGAVAIDWPGAMLLRSPQEHEIPRPQNPDAVYREIPLELRNGRAMVADITLRPLNPDVSATPQTSAWLILVQDVSERVTMERRLAASERLAAVGRFAARTAHQLNNPLDGVQRYIALAQRADQAQGRDYLDKARGGLTRMAQMIRELINQGRPRQQEGDSTSIAQLLQEAIVTLAPRAEALGVNIVTEADDCAASRVTGAMYQVFSNLIRNALDAMAQGGQLTIRIAPHDAGCIMEFADSGMGIDAHDAQRMFEPYYTTKSPGEGTGLGLAICQEIVACAGGRIWAQPRHPRGTTISVYLPLPANARTQGAGR